MANYTCVPPPSYYDSDDPWSAPSAPSIAPARSDADSWAIPSDPPTPLSPTATLAPPTTSPPLAVPPASTAPIDIEAWTSSALASLSLSTRTVGTGDPPLVIPIDEGMPRPVQSAAAVAAARLVPKRGPPVLQRDSLRKREMLLKGNEGSRARRRWENNNLMGVPNVQPPAPEDLLPLPTHRIVNVPYHVASTWDTILSAQHTAHHAAVAYIRKTAQLRTGLATGAGKGEVPRDLRESAKRSPAVKGWVRALEEPLRKWVVEVRERGDLGVETDVDTETETEVETEAESEVQTDDEGWVRVTPRDLDAPEHIIFRGRNPQSFPSGDQPTLVFDAIGNDETASFKRWIAHAISDYYGLESHSVTLENPTRRVVYVGLTAAAVNPEISSEEAEGKRNGKKKGKKRRNRMHARLTKGEIPRPLWEVVC